MKMDESVYSLERKWSKAALSEGWTAFPNLLLLYQVRLKLKPQHICVLMHLLSYWWEGSKNPFPSTKTLADRIGIQPRQVRRYFEYLENEVELEIEGKKIIGLVKRIKRLDGQKGRTSNEYDLSNLILALNLISEEKRDLENKLRSRSRNKQT